MLRIYPESRNTLITDIFLDSVVKQRNDPQYFIKNASLLTYFIKNYLGRVPKLLS